MNSTLPPVVSRREFLKTTATAAAIAAVPMIVPGSALGAEGKAPPSERINLGIIGCGSMGTSNLNACAKEPDVVVTAACDVWDARLETVEDWKEEFREGVVYYLAGGRVRGVLLWNVWGKVDEARALIADEGPFTAENVKGKL